MSNRLLNQLVISRKSGSVGGGKYDFGEISMLPCRIAISSSLYRKEGDFSLDAFTTTPTHRVRNDGLSKVGWRTLVTFMIAILVLTVVSKSVNAQDSLSRYLQTAAENNPALKSKFHQYHAALEKVPQVGALPDPSVTFGYFISPIETRVGPQRFRAGIKQKFPWFGTLQARKSVEAARAKAKYEAFEAAKQELFFDVKQTYYKLYILERQKKLLKENLSFIKANKDIANVRFESDEGSMVDVLRANMEIAELENNLAKVKDRRAPLMEQFQKHLNRPIDTGELTMPDTLSKDTLTMTKKALMDSILTNNEDLEQLQQKQRMLGKKQRAAQKEGMPSLSLSLNYINTGQRTDADVPDDGKDAFFPQVGISLPIYRSKYKAMVEEASLKQQSVQKQEEDKRNRLTVQLEKAWQDYRDAGRRIELYKNQLQRARQALNLLSTKYSTGEGDFEELLRMERKSLQYGFQLAEARVDRNIAVAMMRYLASME